LNVHPYRRLLKGMTPLARIVSVSAVLLTVAGAYTAAGPRAVAEPSAVRLVALPGSAGQTTGHQTGAYVSNRMSVELTLQSRDPAGLSSALRSAYTEGSPGYHKWLAAGQFDARYAPASSVRAAVTAYLRSAGLTVAGSSSPFLLRAIGSSRQVEAALGTTLSTYRGADQARFYANSTAVRLPAGIAADVLGVTGLTDTVHLSSLLDSMDCTAIYPTATQLYTELGTGQLSEPFFDMQGYGGGPACSGLTPSQTNSIYGAPDVGPRGKGAGVTMAVFELSGYQTSDITTWARQFYGPGYTPHLDNITVDGGPLNPACPAADPCPPDENGYWGDGEVVGDIETALAVAPDVRQIEVYNAPEDTTGQTTLDEYAAIAKQDSAAVVSISWATCENALSAGYVQAENVFFEQMAMQGQSVFSGSGDTGAFECVTTNFTYVQNAIDPAVQPWVTGVGGTSLENYNPGTNPDPGPPPAGTETVWNPANQCSSQPPAQDNDGVGGLFWCANVGAGGGGFSQYWGRPFYQYGPGVANPAYPNASGRRNSSGIGECVLAAAGTPCREYPDVSADADTFTGFSVYCTGTASLPNSLCALFSAGEPDPGWFDANGTSLAGPLWAAIIADRDSYQGMRSGNVNPWLYQLLRTDPSRYFTDVTGEGALQAVATNNGIFPSAPGYDMATGIGTPRMAALITGR
jgi:subtilase family serine protease